MQPHRLSPRFVSNLFPAGTIAGQVVLQGFLNIHISTWLRRLITRTAAIIPAAVLQYVYGDRGTYK